MSQRAATGADVARRPRLVAVALAVIVGAAGAVVSVGAAAHAAPAPGPRPQVSRRLNRTPQLPEIDRSHLIVKFRSHPADLNARIASAGARVEGSLGSTGWTALAVDGNLATVQSRLKRDPTIARVEQSYVRHAATVPNDPKWSTQNDYLGPLRMDRAWDRSTGQGVVVADLDTGIALQHPDLAGRIVGTGIDKVNPGTSAQDDNGHGTMTAGIIAANRNNGKGIAGIAPSARILPVKVLDDAAAGTDVDIAAGIVSATAASPKPKVINMSISGAGASPVICDAITSAIAADIVVVVAMGNTGDDSNNYPASCPGVVAVSATDHAGALMAFSSYGWRTDIAAPGLDITSTALDVAHPTADAYDTESGTSFSAPIVSGVVALIRAQHPEYDAAETVDALLRTARDIGEPGRDRAFGRGMVDPLAALGGNALAPAPVLAEGSDEPNDTPADATTIGLATRTASFVPETDEDWYRATLSAGWYRASVSGGTGDFEHDAQAIVELYDASNHLLASQEWPATGNFFVVPTGFDFKITSAGAYFLRVRNHNGSTASYSITLASVSQPALFTKTPFQFDANNPSRVQSVGSGDLNGDGRTDIALLMGDTSLFSDTLVVMDQTPARSYEVGDVVGLPPGVSGGGLVVADATGDGKADVLIPSSDGTILLPQGAGQLDLDAGGYVGSNSASDVAVGDVNGDTKADLVEAGPFGIVANFGDGGGGFGAPVSITSAATKSLAIDNVTGSSDADVVGVGTDGSVNAYAHTTGNSFSTKAVGSVTSGNSVAIDPASKDIVVSRRSSTGELHRFHKVASAWTDNTIPVAANPEPVAIADVDGDSNADIVTLHDSTGKVGVVPLAGGTEQLFSTDATPSSSYDSRAVLAGDVDDDGAPDVVVGTSFGFATLIHRYETLPANFGGQLLTGMTPTAGLANADAHDEVALTLAHAPANADGTTVKVYGPNGDEVAGDVNVASNIVTFTPSGPLADGSYAVRTDGLQDADTPIPEGSTGVLGFVVGNPPDETAPTVSFIAPPTGFRTTNHESISFSTNDNTAMVYCSKDNAPFNYSTPCTSPVSFNNESKTTHTLRVFARDAAGNESALNLASWTYRPAPDGYWMLGRGGTVYPFGTAPGLGKAPTSSANDLAVSPSGYGYWIVDAAGRVFAYGDAKPYGNANGLLAGETVTSISRTVTGKGYWLFTSKGRVFNKGDAKFYGDMRAIRLAGPVLDSVATPTGKGYYMVASDGGVFSFGNAHYYGSKGGQKLAAPVRTLTPDPDGVGYWLVGTNGAVYSFQATYHGSMAGTRLAKPVVGMVSYGNGYLMVAADGGIFNFSSKPFKGSLGGNPPKIPIVSVAVYP
jgi:subtilisin family serine protease